MPARGRWRAPALPSAGVPFEESPAVESGKNSWSASGFPRSISWRRFARWQERPDRQILPFLPHAPPAHSQPEAFEQPPAPPRLPVLHPVFHVRLHLLHLRLLIGRQDLKDFGV